MKAKSHDVEAIMKNWGYKLDALCVWFSDNECKIDEWLSSYQSAEIEFDTEINGSLPNQSPQVVESGFPGMECKDERK